MTGSEDDRSPVIQLWDLRFATSPTRVLEGHKRGVLSLSWCQQDADLLLSASKDNQVLCWNPNSNVENGEVKVIRHYFVSCCTSDVHVYVCIIISLVTVQLELLFWELFL